MDCIKLIGAMNTMPSTSVIVLLPAKNVSGIGQILFFYELFSKKSLSQRLRD
jgi:hypothetical protein